MQVCVLSFGINEALSLTSFQGTWSVHMHCSRHKLNCKRTCIQQVCVLIPVLRLYAVPDQLGNKSFEERLDAMEEYWESEVPRLGEPEASGWAVWDAYRHDQAPRFTKSVEVALDASDSQFSVPNFR